MVARQIYEDPSILPQAMVAPYRERIAVGDYAGALAYGLPARTMQLVPSIINGTFNHRGGASVARNP
jgi:hypothetical protein